MGQFKIEVSFKDFLSRGKQPGEVSSQGKRSVPKEDLIGEFELTFSGQEKKLNKRIKEE